MNLPTTLNYWFLQTVAMALTVLIIPNLTITSIFGALLTVVGMSLVNATIWDAALFFSFPQALTAQAMLLLFTNGIIFWILVKLLPGIEVKGILPALVAPIVFAICSMLISHYGKDIDWNAVFEFVVETMGKLKEHFYETAPPTPVTGSIPIPAR